MDDSQLEQELAAYLDEGTPADKGKPSEVEAETPQGEEAETETETEVESDDEDEKPETDEKDPKDDEDEDEPKKKVKLSGVERLKRRLAAAEIELAATRSRQPADGEVSKDEIERIVGKPPKEEDFKGDFLAFERAQTVYEMRKANAEDRVREQVTERKTAHQNARREAAEAHQERVSEFAEKVSDFQETLKKASADGLKASPTVEDLILDSDKSAHLLYHLAKNPDRLARLNDMSEREAAREIGRIEARLSLPNPKTKTAAPKPVTPPKGGAAPSTPERDIDAYISRKYGNR